MLHRPENNALFQEEVPEKEKTPVSTATKTTLTYGLPERGMTCRPNSLRSAEKPQYGSLMVTKQHNVV